MSRGVFLSDDGEGELVVEVNGSTVSEAIQAKIVDATFTTEGSRKGTGRVLAICAKIVVDHRGTLAVDASSELGGARFTLRVPGPKESGRRSGVQFAAGALRATPLRE